MDKEKYREYFRSLSDEALNSSIDVLWNIRSEEGAESLFEVEQVARQVMMRRIDVLLEKQENDNG